MDYKNEIIELIKNTNDKKILQFLYRFIRDFIYFH